MTEDYDVVIDTLTKHRDKLWKMTRTNMYSEFFTMGIMDDIRLEQIDQIDAAIRMWKEKKTVESSVDNSVYPVNK